MANNNPNARPWLGPHAILEAVERLVVAEHEKAAEGWTQEEIMASLMQTHPHADTLWEDFDSLVETGDLKQKRVESGMYHQKYYKLSLPYLPPWFRPEAVLEAVGELDEDEKNAGGWTWEQMKDSLMRKHQPLPPEFDTVLRTMLSVLRQRGYLTWGASGPRHYRRRRQASAPVVEPDPTSIPGYLWCWYLGYKLGTGRDALDDSGDDEEDAYNPNAPSWLGPWAVLQEMERLECNDITNASDGWTCEEIRDFLMQRHQQDHLPEGLDLDATLQATLATLSKRGYLRPSGFMSRPNYSLSITTFPTWFRPDAVLQAVGELDDANNNDKGSSCTRIMGYFNTKHGPLPPRFRRQLLSMLTVLRQRGHLTGTNYGGRGSHKMYTRRGAPATGIPDYLRLCYYAGYRLTGIGRKDIDDRVGKSTETTETVPTNIPRNRRQKTYNNKRKEAFSIETQPFLPKDAGNSVGSSDNDNEHRRMEVPPAGEQIGTSTAAGHVSVQTQNMVVVSEIEDDVEPLNGPPLMAPGSTGSKLPGVTELTPPRAHQSQSEKQYSAFGTDPESQLAEEKQHLVSGLKKWMCGIPARAKQLFGKPTTQEEKKKQKRTWYRICTICVSIFGHVLLLGLSFVHVLREETSGDHEEDKRWLKWGVMNLAVPVLLLILMFFMHYTFFVNLEGTEDEKKAKWKKTAFLFVLSGSKIAYDAIKEAPGPKVLLLCIAHLFDFVIDTAGALYLWEKKGILDYELPG